jgi:Flp pilus assembly protein TadD
MTFTLYMLGRYGEALAAAQAACERFPDVPFLHAIRALVLAEMGRMDDAHAAVAEVRRLDPRFDAGQLTHLFVHKETASRLQAAARKAGF